MSLDAQVKFSNKAMARGRNGYFTPHHANVWDSSLTETLYIEVFSKRAGQTEPISLHLSKAEAVELGEAIVKVAKGVNRATVSSASV
jgi:hypothetical protein